MLNGGNRELHVGIQCIRELTRVPDFVLLLQQQEVFILCRNVFRVCLCMKVRSSDSQVEVRRKSRLFSLEECVL